MSQSLTLCDLFKDLKAFDGRAIQIKAELFLDRDRTATAANCDQAFIEDSFVWATALHLDAGPILAPDERAQLEGARATSIENRRLSKHVRITALLEGTVETDHKYGKDRDMPGRILLSKVSGLLLEPLPDAEDLPVIDVCDVFADLSSYNGKRVAIRGDLISGYHGAALYGVGCKTTLQTSGYRWPPALHFSVPFHDSQFQKPLERDAKRGALTHSQADELTRAPKRPETIYRCRGDPHS